LFAGLHRQHHWNIGRVVVIDVFRVKHVVRRPQQFLRDVGGQQRWCLQFSQCEHVQRHGGFFRGHLQPGFIRASRQLQRCCLIVGVLVFW